MGPLVPENVDGVTIFHLARRCAWEAAQGGDSYRPASFEDEGFIHASTAEQVEATANRYYLGAVDLVLLRIESVRVEVEIRYENLYGGEELFPHIYGPLALGAVTASHALKPGTDGTFVIPDELLA